MHQCDVYRTLKVIECSKFCFHSLFKVHVAVQLYHRTFLQHTEPLHLSIFDALNILLNFKRLVMSFQSAQSLNISCAVLPFYFCFECFRTIFISIAFKCKCQASLACLLHSRQLVEICFVPCGTVHINFACIKSLI